MQSSCEGISPSQVQSLQKRFIVQQPRRGAVLTRGPTLHLFSKAINKDIEVKKDKDKDKDQDKDKDKKDKVVQ